MAFFYCDATAGRPGGHEHFLVWGVPVRPWAGRLITGQPTKREQWISQGNCIRNSAVRLVKLTQLWKHARQVRADFTIFVEALPRLEQISHTWPLILEFAGPNNSPYGRILSVDARLFLLGYSTEEVIHPNWEEELQECGSAQWRGFAGEEKQVVPKAEREEALLRWVMGLWYKLMWRVIWMVR